MRPGRDRKRRSPRRLSEQIARTSGDADEAELVNFVGEGIGRECEETEDCRDGLVCKANLCVASESKPLNAKCLLTDECDPDNLKPVDIEDIIATAKAAEKHLTKLYAALIERI